ncbi:unnamed protein product [Enterobius vermicularis]|uniref:Ulp1 protease family, C-terminal catalytic domain-containing protein n=1 Tax=Enterobius vermicularis TaxID=51028 RepID=A0A0N4V2H6_ENTVE|nr:unnamed protein product [Enterobius vermicularis]
MSLGDHSKYLEVFAKTSAGPVRDQSEQHMLKCIFEAYAILYKRTDLSEAAEVINVKAEEDVVDPTNFSVALQEIMAQTKTGGDKLKDRHATAAINKWLAAVPTGQDPIIEEPRRRVTRSVFRETETGAGSSETRSRRQTQAPERTGACVEEGPTETTGEQSQAAEPQITVHTIDEEVEEEQHMIDKEQAADAKALEEDFDKKINEDICQDLEELLKEHDIKHPNWVKKVKEWSFQDAYRLMHPNIWVKHFDLVRWIWTYSDYAGFDLLVVSNIVFNSRDRFKTTYPWTCCEVMPLCRHPVVSKARVDEFIRHDNPEAISDFSIQMCALYSNDTGGY